LSTPSPNAFGVWLLDYESLGLANDK